PRDRMERDRTERDRTESRRERERSRDDYDDDEEEERPKRKRKKKKRNRDSEGGGGFNIAVHPEILGGLAMMGGAVVWFVLGLNLDPPRFFLSPPILFCLGIAAIVRGFTNG